MKRTGLFLMAILLVTGVLAQVKANGKQSLCSYMSNENIFSHMDVGVNVGTTGLGIGVGAFVGAQIGVQIAQKLKSSYLLKFSSVLVCLTGIKFLMSAF